MARPGRRAGVRRALELDLSTVEPARRPRPAAGPRGAARRARRFAASLASRAAGRRGSRSAAPGVDGGLDAASAESFPASDPPAAAGPDRHDVKRAAARPSNAPTADPPISEPIAGRRSPTAPRASSTTATW